MSRISKIKKVKFLKDDFELVYKDFEKFRTDQFDVIYSKSGLRNLDANSLPHPGAYYIHMKDSNVIDWYQMQNSKIILRSVENDYEIDTMLLHSLFIKNKIQIAEMDLNCYSCLSRLRDTRVTRAYLETLIVNYIHPSK